MENKKNDKEPSITSKIKEGVSVQEIESFARKYTTEVFIILSIIIAVFSSIFDIFAGGPISSLFFIGLGAILTIAIPDKIEPFHKKVVTMLCKEEKTMQILIGVLRIIIALFIPFVIFAELGLLSGFAYHHHNKMQSHKANKESK